MGVVADKHEAVKGKLRQTFEVWHPRVPAGKTYTQADLEQMCVDANALLDIIETPGCDAIRRMLRAHFDQYDYDLRHLKAEQHQSPIGSELKGLALASERHLTIFDAILRDGRWAEQQLEEINKQAESNDRRGKERPRVHPVSSVRPSERF